ncbi:hypothetical protein MycrhDRAFT_1465 [Mycolicibacterium rhodesiae JS60]|nr:hypothetical protein MycrhDRAFT_1465 [Mycolicibacterium rhodesiae JS60]
MPIRLGHHRATWGLSTDLFTPAVAVAGTFLIAAVKVRIAFEGWLAVVVALILGLWFLAPNIL